MKDIFVLDAYKEDFESELSHRLIRDGLVIFKNMESPQRFLKTGKSLGSIFMHPDSDRKTGLTHIHYKSDSSFKNQKAFTHLELFPHTDSSSLLDPPSVVMLMCQDSSDSGGEATFVDGLLLYRQLAGHYPKILKALKHKASAIFLNGSQFLKSPVFQQQGDNCLLRFRLDDYVFFGEQLSLYLDQLKIILQTMLKKVLLKPGMGYVANNYRWMHGRSAYGGIQRSMYRLLVDSKLCQQGFSIH